MLYHPQGNGACEGFNQTLLSLLGSLGQDEQMRWPEQLHIFFQEYNTTEHSSTMLYPILCNVWQACPSSC